MSSGMGLRRLLAAVGLARACEEAVELELRGRLGLLLLPLPLPFAAPPLPALRRLDAQAKPLASSPNMCSCTSGVPSPMIALGVCVSVCSGPGRLPMLLTAMRPPLLWTGLLLRLGLRLGALLGLAALLPRGCCP